MLQATPIPYKAAQTHTACIRKNNAIGWAAQNKIVQGVGDNKFDPLKNISREEMAVMFYNYCQYKGIEIQEIHEDSVFADADLVYSWAKKAVAAMHQGGNISGKGENLFYPHDTATRAEVATLLQNFLSALKSYLK